MTSYRRRSRQQEQVELKYPHGPNKKRAINIARQMNALIQESSVPNLWSSWLNQDSCSHT
uniref:Uncharacterized protein n=1 Tax=Utricularia reniformis TaxID=192314 RepID=A0A1Y0AYX8_9LAMI|nr:hypothetical protein AEK19_MT1274 [Utricularia reniformis]ART30365.1 hypothetical protein AEK19_MT1274 [Utricularia reniformis]